MLTPICTLPVRPADEVYGLVRKAERFTTDINDMLLVRRATPPPVTRSAMSIGHRVRFSR